MNKIIKGQFEKRIQHNKYSNTNDKGATFVILYRDEKTWFTIIKFIEEEVSWKTLTVQGDFDEIPEWRVELHWNVEVHPKYWEFFKAESYFSILPEKKEDVISYLISFLGISVAQSTKLWNKYENNLFDELDKNIDLLNDEVDYLFRGKKEDKEKRVETLKNKWKEESWFRKIRAFLYQHGLSEAYSKKVILEFWTKAVEMVKKNPYSLTRVKWIWFKIADKIALNLWIHKDSPSRVYAAIIHTIEEIANDTGSTYTEFSPLHLKTLELLEINLTDKLFFKYLKDLNKDTYFEELDMKIYPQLKILNHKGKILIFLYKHYLWEEYAAEFLLEYNKPIEFKEYSDEDLNGIVKELYKNSSRKVEELNTEQLFAIKNALYNKVSIISGYAGTWKTTIIKTLLYIFRENNINYSLLWPTGKSVDVLGEATGEPQNCSTIHRKIKLLDSDEGEEKIREKVVIVDESSMKDLRVSTALFKAFDVLEKEQGRLILVWDHNQLEPVWIGKLFMDMIISGVFPISKLTQIYRQSKNSSILENCKAIVEWTKVNLQDTDDWKTVYSDNKSAEQVQTMVVSEIVNSKWDNKDIVLTSKRAGALGTTELNKKIQDLIFEDLTELKEYRYEKGMSRFYLGDRVVQTENWYREKEKEIFRIPSYEFLCNPELLKKLNDEIKVINEEKKLTIDLLWNYIEQDIIQTSSYKLGKLIRDENNEIKDIEINVEKKEKEDEIDINVYNWNWGRVIGIIDKWGILNLLTNKDEVVKRTVWFLWDLEEELFQIREDKHLILVAYKNKIIPYTKYEIGDLDLFYASTVHKCQGSQFRKVYAINTSHMNYFCDKKWLYTEISRAEKYVTYFSSELETDKVKSKQFSDRRKWTLLSRLKQIKG